MNKLFDLSGKVAIVTGGSRGIGAAIVEGLAASGANVVIADILEREATVTAKKLSKKTRRKIISFLTDVSKKEDTDSLVAKTVKSLGRVDILVNNAGIFRMVPTEKLSKAEWDKIMAVNLEGYLNCAQSVFPIMRKQRKGSIINNASIAGLFAFPTAAAYNASKAGIVSLTQTLASEWAKYGIRVNCFCPGVVKTAMTADLLKQKAIQEMVKARVLLGRPAKPAEMAGLAVYLASDASSYMTGSVIAIDGGWTAHL